MRTYQSEFPELGTVPEIEALLAAGCVDESWHNDVSPFLVAPTRDAAVYVQSSDPELRESPDGRFVVMVGSFDPMSGLSYYDDPASVRVAYAGESFADALGAMFDPETAARILQRFTLAARFCAVLRVWLTPAEMASVIERNRAEPRADVCHSHDYCDANMAMLDAWQSVTGSDIDGDDESQCALWGSAWTLAMRCEFTMPE